MPRPVIALLTDFGTRDHYVGSMKGVALTICPDAALVDISHDIPPQDVVSGALELSACFRDFPPGTVFLVVIDPGVGTSRRALAAEAGPYRFVAPDNGVLSGVFGELAPARMVAITAAEYGRPVVSRTFEGRDRFAPAAAWLARGVDLAALGPPVEQSERLVLPRPSVSVAVIEGEVIRVDHFGNLITNIGRQAVDAFAPGGAAVDLVVGAHVVERIVATYAEAQPGEVCGIFGSTGHLEVAVRGASAAETLALGRRAPVRIARRA